jgi:Icc-related predicted phosphoesterase
MKLLILSDLHNDISSMPTEIDGRRIDSEADVVVLAGDIHEGVQSPMWAREAFPDKPIVLVAGNHEFYGRYWNRNLRKIREKSEQLGIHFLENDAVEIDGVRFLGCTLWTDFMLFGETMRSTSMATAREKMNDYQRIKLDRKPGENADWREVRSVKLIPELTRRRHRESAEWLDRHLDAGDPAKTVVVTHHAPSDKSIPVQFEGHVLSPVYASNLHQLLGRSALWIHGHIHERCDYMAGDTRVVTNPRGYPLRPGSRAKQENARFDPFFTVEI